MIHSTDSKSRAPVLFVSHGAPDVALEKGAYQDALRAFGEKYRPRAVVVLSAHWRSGRGFVVDSTPAPATIYDFSGFDPALRQLQYPVVTDQALSAETHRLLAAAGQRTELLPSHGCDHGLWVPLRLLYPAADVPIIYVSLNNRATPDDYLAAGAALRPLRDQGVMILGSGGFVHNLGALDYDHPVDGHPAPWAAEFESWAIERLGRRDIETLAEFRHTAPHAREAHPSWEHFAPLFVALGATTAEDSFSTLFEGWSYGSLSMRTLLWQKADHAPST